MSKSTTTPVFNRAVLAELATILGDKWGICRNTAVNRERYGKCITHKQYAEAEREAFKRLELTTNRK